MKLLLLESVEGLGRPGDQVSVKDGYARNFLLPHRKAVRITRDALRMLDKLRLKAEEEERAAISSAEEMAAKIAGQQVAVQARATEEGHLFGSVTEKDIHSALTAAGWDLSVRAVRLAAHLKEAGLHEVELHLYGEIGTTIQVEVVPVDVEGHPIEPITEPSETEGGGEAPGEAGSSSGEGVAGPDPAADPTTATADT